MKATYRKLLTLAAALLTAAGFIACQDDQSQEWTIRGCSCPPIS